MKLSILLFFAVSAGFISLTTDRGEGRREHEPLLVLSLFFIIQIMVLLLSFLFGRVRIYDVRQRGADGVAEGRGRVFDLVWIQAQIHALMFNFGFDGPALDDHLYELCLEISCCTLGYASNQQQGVAFSYGTHLSRRKIFPTTTPQKNWNLI